MEKEKQCLSCRDFVADPCSGYGGCKWGNTPTRRWITPGTINVRRVGKTDMIPIPCLDFDGCMDWRSRPVRRVKEKEPAIDPRNAYWAEYRQRTRTEEAVKNDASDRVPCPRCGNPMPRLTKAGKIRIACGKGCAHRHVPVQTA